MGEKAPLEDAGRTHGICPDCDQHFSPQWDGFNLSDYLDTFEEPVVIFSPDSRVIAFNESYSRAYLDEAKKPKGLLGGEFLECANARLPEGCGHTVHCRDCAIRNTIAATLRTGKPQKDIPAFLNTTVHGKTVVKKLRISGEMHGLMVCLLIEEEAKRSALVAS